MIDINYYSYLFCTCSTQQNQEKQKEQEEHIHIRLLNSKFIKENFIRNIQDFCKFLSDKYPKKILSYKSNFSNCKEINYFSDPDLIILFWTPEEKFFEIVNATNIEEKIKTHAADQQLKQTGNIKTNKCFYTTELQRFFSWVIMNIIQFKEQHKGFSFEFDWTKNDPNLFKKHSWMLAEPKQLTEQEQNITKNISQQTTNTNEN